MIIRVALFFFSCIHAILCLRYFPSPRVVAATRHSTRLFKRVYHNDDGSFDVDSAPKLSFNENFYRVLEVDSNCSQKDLKKSFLKMIFTYHPDRISRGSSWYENQPINRSIMSTCVPSCWADDHLLATSQFYSLFQRWPRLRGVKGLTYSTDDGTWTVPAAMLYSMETIQR